MVTEQAQLSRDGTKQIDSNSSMSPYVFTTKIPLNLNTLAAKISPAWDVRSVNRVSVEAFLISGSWGTANVILRGSVDGRNWTTITTLTGAGYTPSVDVDQYAYLIAETSIVEGSAATASFKGYGYVTSEISLAAHATSHESGGADTINHDSLTGFVANEHRNVISAIKESEETLNTSTTLQDDDDLKAALLANENADVQGIIFAYADNTTPDIQFSITVPSGATMRFLFAMGNTVEVIESSGTKTGTFALTTTVRAIQFHGTVINGANAGDVQLQWTQAVSDGGDIHVEVNSDLRKETI